MLTHSRAISESSVVVRLRAAGCVFAEDEAHLLISAASGADDLERMVQRRVAGLPLEQILGWAQFCGQHIAVEPGVFVPRRRTEFLAAQAIELLHRRTHPVVLDLCCGSAAIGTVIMAQVSPVEVYAADIQPAAIACARRNLGDRGRVFEGDLFAPLPAELRGRFDVVVANAPYVPTSGLSAMPPEARLHEPALTLDGGSDGLDLLRRIVAEAPDWLTPGGHLLIECSESQASQAVEIFTARDLGAAVARLEESDATVVVGTK